VAEIMAEDISGVKEEVRGVFFFMQCGGVERDVQQGTKKD
jgi:hypothetical protein